MFSFVLVIVKNCLKDQAKHTQLEPSQDQAMADPIIDLRQQLADHGADKDNQNVSLTLAIVADCTRKQRDGTLGTKAVVSNSVE